ncbi:hypothetical protein UA08_03638 [Talaromyces atroroseus]|uniref:Transcription factor hoxa13 n=1 Tax=Talaromyces atroroseus TaxID=1441469 RepID=A0A225AJ21_TALAT|nr:hypothetical protein UA08_03638 [Talaromyces atroroseus]OKL61482.1 hypothetical protein UA08_03638 [Talaromyces atroroseus]
MSSPVNERIRNGNIPDSLEEAKPSGPGRRDRPRRSYFRWLLALVARLCIWYTVLTPFLRCPSDISALDDSSPRVCKPYLITRSYVDPHVDRYYQAYAAPYVERARPYTSVLNERVYTPASRIAKHGYETYGAPAIAQAGEYGQQKWEVVAVPQLMSIQASAHTLYKDKLDPYVQQVLDVVTPYTETISNQATDIHNGYILPSYIRSKPLIVRAYSSSRDVLTRTVIPLAHQGWSTLAIFVKGSLLPTVTGLYSENVEPQLVKIGERLASYREGKKLRTVVDEYESSTEYFVTGAATPTASTVSEPQTTAATTSTTKSAEATQSSLTLEQRVETAREQIASDLLIWQQKFAMAADKGVDDLGDRVSHIVNSQLESGAKTHGEALIEALHTVQQHEILRIKEHINEIIQQLPPYDAPYEEEKANEDLLHFIRLVGTEIRDRAHALREWYNTFEKELDRRVTAAADSTLEVLDSIRDLGLQEIGIRWAVMDEVTYKDWAKYHALKKQFDKWRGEVYEAGLKHAKVEEAKIIAEDILSRGMTTAEDAAKELSRLKEVGKWKIQAREVSEDFETRTEPPPALVRPEEDNVEEESLSESISIDDPEMSGASSAAPSATFEEVETEFDKTTTVRIELADVTPEVPTGATADRFEDENEPEVAEALGEKDDVRSSDSKVWGGVAAQVVTNQVPILDDDQEHRFSEQMVSLASEASERYAEATKAASEALFAQATTSSVGDQAASVVRDQYSSAVEAASSILYGTTPSVGEQFAIAASERYEQAVAAASSAFYNLPVPGSQTTTSVLESISSVASSRLQEGLSIASAQFSNLKASIAPTPTATQNPIFLDAQRRYYEAIGLAHDQYSAFISSASDVIYEPEPSPSPTPSVIDPQGLLEEAISQFHQVSGLASSSLAAVVASASSVADKGGDSARSVIDDALSKYSNAMAAASSSLSVASESASSAIFGTPTGTFESITSQASERWQSMISQASEQIYGAPTPLVQQLYDQQVSRFEALESFVSELVVGKEPAFTESVMSRLRSAYETPYPAAALSSASSYGSEAFSSASSHITDVASHVGDGATNLQSEASSVINSAASKVKDEL